MNPLSKEFCLQDGHEINFDSLKIAQEFNFDSSETCFNFHGSFVTRVLLCVLPGGQEEPLPFSES